MFCATRMVAKTTDLQRDTTFVASRIRYGMSRSVFQSGHQFLVCFCALHLERRGRSDQTETKKENSGARFIFFVGKSFP